MCCAILQKLAFAGSWVSPSARRALGYLAVGPFLCYSFNTNNGLYLLCPRSWTSCTLCVPCWISRHLTTFSRVWRSSAADQLHLSLGGVSTMSQVCLRSILFKPKSCICSNIFHRCHLFLKDWILHWIPALAVHGVILDWLLALYVHRVRNLFLGFRFDEAFFKQSFQPLFFFYR